MPLRKATGRVPRRKRRVVRKATRSLGLKTSRGRNAGRPRKSHK